MPGHDFRIVRVLDTIYYVWTRRDNNYCYLSTAPFLLFIRVDKRKYARTTVNKIRQNTRNFLQYYDISFSYSPPFLFRLYIQS